jgi:hypothetical protein
VTIATGTGGQNDGSPEGAMIASAPSEGTEVLPIEAIRLARDAVLGTRGRAFEARGKAFEARAKAFEARGRAFEARAKVFGARGRPARQAPRIAAASASAGQVKAHARRNDAHRPRPIGERLPAGHSSGAPSLVAGVSPRVVGLAPEAVIDRAGHGSERAGRVAGKVRRQYGVGHPTLSQAFRNPIFWDRVRS